MKSLLCKMRLHDRYKYLPKVSGDLGEISIACKRCGYGLRYFQGTWDIAPEEVQDSIKKQAEIEYGHVLGMFRGIGKPLRQMEMTLDIIKDMFTTEELLPLQNQLEEMREWQTKLKEWDAE